LPKEKGQIMKKKFPLSALNGWLINWCLTPTLAVFQPYRAFLYMKCRIWLKRCYGIIITGNFDLNTTTTDNCFWKYKIAIEIKVSDVTPNNV
jgi:hypothetical protein